VIGATNFWKNSMVVFLQDDLRIVALFP